MTVRIMTRTYRFDAVLSIGAYSSQDDVCTLFNSILKAAQDGDGTLGGLEQCSFSYGMPEDGLAKISGYVHVNKTNTITEAAARGWICDDRIIGGDVEWRPVLPGRNGI